MEIVLICVSAFFGVTYADSLGFYASRMMSWRKTTVSGLWVSEFVKDGQTISENIEIFGSLGDVSWGILKVRSEEPNQIIPYRVKLVEEFKNVYSVVFKPQDRSMADIGAGTIVFDESSGCANGNVVAFDFDKQESVVRAISVHRATDAQLTSVS